MNCFKNSLIALTLILLCNFAYAEPFLVDLEGKKIPFESLKGKWVLINYWASWCQTCVNEISELNTFYKENKDKVALYAVNFDNIAPNEQYKLIKKLAIHYPSLSVNPADSLDLGPIHGVPATFVFDPEGRLTKTLYGGQTHRSLYRVIASR